MLSICLFCIICLLECIHRKKEYISNYIILKLTVNKEILNSPYKIFFKNILYEYRTYFHYACENIYCNENNTKDVLEFYLKAGGNLNIPDENGNTVFHILTDSNKFTYDIIKLCLDYDGDLNAKDHFGETPFNTICANISHVENKTEIIEICIERKGNLTIKTEYFYSPFTELCNVSNLDFFNKDFLVMCLKNGADLDDQQRDHDKILEYSRDKEVIFHSYYKTTIWKYHDNKVYGNKLYLIRKKNKEKYLREREKYIMLNLQIIFNIHLKFK
jgi:hypothetical protein